MSWWHYLLLLAATTVGGAHAGVLRGRWETYASARPADRIRAGSGAAATVAVITDRLRPARALRDGEDLVVPGRGTQPPEQPAGWAASPEMTVRAAVDWTPPAAQLPLPTLR